LSKKYLFNSQKTVFIIIHNDLTNSAFKLLFQKAFNNCRYFSLSICQVGKNVIGHLTCGSKCTSN